MIYEILYKNKIMCEIDRTNGSVIIYDSHLPFDIYLEESDDFDDRLNNIVNFQSWCASRILSLDRVYLKEILNFYNFSQCITDKEREKIGIATRCLSLNDCFWIRKKDEQITWEQINLFQNTAKNSVFEIALIGKSFTLNNQELIQPELTTDGKAPKAWLRKDNHFYLLKGSINNSVVKEVEASHILRKLGFQNLNYEKDIFNNNYDVSKCEIFTSEFLNYVKAGWFHIWLENHDLSIIDYIYKYKEQFDKMNLADYLIGNSDEHGHNWGFLYNNDFQIIGLSPHMDFDHAFESTNQSICLPSYFLGMPITQLEMAKQIVLNHPEYLVLDVDLSEFQYKNFVQDRITILKDYIYQYYCNKIDMIKNEFFNIEQQKEKIEELLTNIKLNSVLYHELTSYAKLDYKNYPKEQINIDYI